ncbi:MAG TPA: alpha/beta hydrolase [Steroidobacteraceae bacterium]|nr:alpha/beta hydrolase [Steroidobacteraceae bacterium]
MFVARTTGVLILAAVSLAARAQGAPIPEAIYTDPPHDARFPASMVVLHVPTHGVRINGLAYLPSGPGPHPVLVICHGLPGNEKNLDLAQAVRRAGWVAVTFNYRGSWGSPGRFSFLGNLEDTAAVMAYLRNPRNAGALRLDPRRIVIAGHSMGGWVAAKIGSRDPGLRGVILISAWDPSAPMTHEKAVAEMADDMESLAGVTAESMAADREAHLKEMALAPTAQGLARKPLLVLSADDGLAPGTDALIASIRAHGGRLVSSEHAATDHGWSDRRIELEASVIRWLQSLP